VRVHVADPTVHRHSATDLEASEVVRAFLLGQTHIFLMLTSCHA
jgi:hypothetical protein